MELALDRDPAVCAQFAVSAAKLDLAGGDTSAWDLCAMYAAEGLSKGEWPVTCFYLFTEQGIPPKDKADAELTAAEMQIRLLYQALCKIGPPPVDTTGKKLLGGWPSHQRVANYPLYHVTNADDSIISENIDVYVKSCDGSNIVSLGAGNGAKDARLVRQLLERGCEIKEWYINDISKEAAQENKIRLIEAGLPEDKIHIILGDVTKPALWNDQLFDELAKDKARTVVLAHGAFLFNDFNLPTILFFLQNFCERTKQDTEFFVSGDSTVDPETLKRSYHNPPTLQWMLTGFIFTMRAGGFLVDPRRTNARIDIKKGGFNLEVVPVITTKKQQLPHSEKARHSYTLKEGYIPCQKIFKYRQENLRAFIVNAGHEVTHCMGWNGKRDPKFSKVDLNIWHFCNKKRPKARVVREPSKQPALA